MVKRESKLLLFTYRQSHTGFLLVPKSVTLNDIERVMAVISRNFTEFCSFGTNYVTVK